MRALSILQPYAELILRGEKTIEYRSRPTRLIGQPFYIYASKKWGGVNGHPTACSLPSTASRIRVEGHLVPRLEAEHGPIRRQL